MWKWFTFVVSNKILQNVAENKLNSWLKIGEIDGNSWKYWFLRMNKDVKVCWDLLICRKWRWSTCICFCRCCRKWRWSTCICFCRCCIWLCRCRKWRWSTCICFGRCCICSCRLEKRFNLSFTLEIIIFIKFHQEWDNIWFRFNFSQNSRKILTRSLIRYDETTRFENPVEPVTSGFLIEGHKYQYFESTSTLLDLYWIFESTSEHLRISYHNCTKSTNSNNIM